MEILNETLLSSFKKGSKIKIKKKNRGKFTEYCGGEVTQECIDKAKKSKNPTLRKRATFADNARKWKHAQGGTLIPKHYTGTGKDGIHPSRDWSGTLPEQLINASENPDSIGWDPANRRWYAPTLPGYDPNQFGMGVDRNKTPGFKDKVKVDETGREYLTEKDERYLRHMAIDAANESANARYRHAQDATGIKGSVSPKHDAITISAIYNLGQGFVANKLFENLPAMKALFDRDSNKYQQYVQQYYKDKGRYERIKNENEFFKKKGL